MMGYGVNGVAIVTAVDGMVAGGICVGAIEVRADGQRIVVLGARHAIGGYRKIGSGPALDFGKLTQLTPGGIVSFEAISIEQAHNLLLLNQQQVEHTKLQPVTGGSNG